MASDLFQYGLDGAVAILLIVILCLFIAARIAVLWSSDIPQHDFWKPVNTPKNELFQSGTPSSNQIGYSSDKPLFVESVPSPETYYQARKDAEKEFRDSATEWGTLIFTGFSAVIFFVQLIVVFIQTLVFGIQAGRLKDSIVKMDEIARGQTADMAKSIAQGARAADAMSEVANRLEESALDQRKFWKMQMRAYLSVGYGEVANQNREKGYRNEIRLILANTGNTPAHEVIYSAKADVFSHPIPDDFDLTLAHTEKASVSVIAPGQNRIMTGVLPRIYSDEEIAEYTEGGKRLYMWGMATFKDIFGERHTVHFCHFVSWYSSGRTMGTNSHRHNDSD